MSDDLYIGPTMLEPGAPATGDHLARRLLVPLSFLFFLLVMVFYVFFTTSKVDGESMEPTLRHGDRLLVTKSYDEAQRRDVIIFEILEHGETSGLIKRVVAVSGDTVEVRQGIALVNGKVESLESIETSERDSTYQEPVVIPDGYVYVLGDNRPVALDSRDLGPIPLSSIRGKVTYIFAPLGRMGRVR